MADPLALVYDFEADLTRFADATDEQLTAILQESAETAAEAITVGNQYGPGVPVDTGFARASFRVGINDAVDGPTDRPWISRKVTKPGTQVFTDVPNLSAIAGAKLGDSIFVTTSAEYPQYLEFEPKRRRYGANAGASTVFIDPVEQRFGQIVDDAADRVGYGAP